jgi:hypothetical protein
LAVSGYVHGGESSILIGGVSMPFRTADQNREGRLANVGNVTTGGADYWIPGQLGGTLTIECPKQLAVLTGLALQGLYTATINFMTGVSRSVIVRLKSIKDGLDWDKEQTTQFEFVMSGTPFDITNP